MEVHWEHDLRGNEVQNKEKRAQLCAGDEFQFQAAYIYFFVQCLYNSLVIVIPLLKTKHDK